MFKKLFAKKEYNFNFMKMQKMAFVFSLFLMIASIASLSIKGLNFGIDFQGGILVEVSAQKAINIADVRQDLAGLKDLSIQSVGTDGKSILIQAQPLENQVGDDVVKQIKAVLSPDSYQYERIEVIGPTVGNELKHNSLLASILALLAIAIYIWFRFEWPFAIGCLVSLSFTLIFILGLFSFFAWDFNMIVVAAMLSLAGYDCNDTIVTYDRVRENLQKHKKKSSDDILNLGINETLSRTILTSLSTLIMILVLLVLGGATLEGFALALSFGIVSGTYSSLFVAVPILRFFNIKSITESKNVEPNFN